MSFRPILLYATALSMAVSVGMSTPALASSNVCQASAVSSVASRTAKFTKFKPYRIKVTAPIGLKAYKSWKPGRGGEYYISYIMERGENARIVGKRIVGEGPSRYTWLKVENRQKKIGWFVKAKRAGVYPYKKI